MKGKTIINRNYKRQLHGYQERHWKGTLWYIVNYKNDNRIGYEENHRGHGVTNFYII